MMHRSGMDYITERYNINGQLAKGGFSTIYLIEPKTKRADDVTLYIHLGDLLGGIIHLEKN